MTFRPFKLGFRTSKAQWGGMYLRVVDAEYTISTTASVSLTLTVEDPHSERFSQMPGLWEDGVEVTYGAFTGVVQSVESGGSADKSDVVLHAISQGVVELDNGGMDPSYLQSMNVPGWMDSTVGQLRKRYHKVIDPNLSDKTAEVSSDSGDGSDEKTTAWDVVNETAKKCGAWAWFTDSGFYFGKPSWLVDTGLQPEWTITWDSWKSHTEVLTKQPHYSQDFSKKLWEGREELTVTLQDPEEIVSGDRLARNIRPGDRLVFKGDLAPEDPLWIVTEVSLPFVNTDPVTVVAWRPIDPPEIVDENGSSGSGTAGVPQGPLGANGWNGDQLENAAEIVKEGQREKKADDAIRLAVFAAMGESSLHNLGYGDDAVNPDGSMNDSLGLFQQQARHEGGNWSRTDRTTPSKAAEIFYMFMDKHNWQKYYNEGGASEVYGGNYGPGHSANSASLAVHNIQHNRDPLHYAQILMGKAWDDAKVVMDACIAAGESAGGGGDGKVPSGPVGERMQRSINAMTGKYIDVDGAFGCQCADVGMRYAKDMWGIGMVVADGSGYWQQSQIAPYCDAIPANQPPRYGDIASWSGSYGAYTNGGAGHIAIYLSGNPGSGSCTFLSQNPGPARSQPLSVSGIQGWMRPKK